MNQELLGTGAAGTLESLLNEKVVRFTLPNGLAVLFKEDHSAPVCSVQLWVKTGSIHEGGDLGSGLSHFLEHMLFKGTERRHGREISALVQGKGGYINAYTSFDRTVYYINLPSEHTETAIDILGDAAFHSTLPPAEVEKEKGVILREIDMCLDDPQQQLWQTLFETAFREHPYRAPVIGYKDVFEAVTRDDLAAYYRSRYTPNNAVLVVAGDWDEASCRETAERILGGLPRRKMAPVVLPPEPEQLAFRRNDLFADVSVSHVAFGYKIPGLAHPDTPALKILGNIIGHGHSSLLWKKLRDEKRLVHYIDAGTWTPGSAGLFFISLVTDPDKRDAAWEAVEKEIERIGREGIPPEQIRKTVRQAVASEVNVRKTMQGQAGQLGIGEIVGDLDYPRVFLRWLAETTADDVRRVLNRYLKRERLTGVSLSPKESAPAPAKSDTGQAPRKEFERFDLANGARLLLQPDHRLPNLHFRLIFRGGPLHEDPSARGATSILADLLTRDTENRTHEEVAEVIEGTGGRLSSFSGNNTFGISVEVMPDDLELALELLEDAALRPLFRDDTFARERDAEVADLKEDLDEIFEVGRKTLRRRFFGDHPFALEPSGTVESLEKLTVDDIRKLYRRLVVASNAVLAVAGDFDDAALRPRLEKLLEKFPAGQLSLAPQTYPGPPEPVEIVEKMPREQAVVLQGFPDVGLTDPRFSVGEMADELFSGMASQLFERVREELGLAYFVGSSRIVGPDTGMFYFYAGTNPATAGKVREEIDREIARVQRGEISDEEIQRCRNSLKARKRMSLQANGARAMEAALNALFELGVRDWHDYDSRVDAVTREQIRDFAREFLDRSRRVRLVVGPEQS